MNEFEKLLEKKKKEGKFIDPEHAKAKMEMLDALKGEMSGLMKNDLEKVKGLKSVQVASNDKEGLEAGLDKAKEMLGSEDEEEESEEEAEPGMPGLDSHESSEPEMTDEDIAKLEELLKKLKSKKMLG